MKQKLGFRTRARLINQLGEQLIKNESIALLELIKNSYDADATECKVIMEQPEDVNNGTIIIQDNGSGMNYNVLSTVWLEIGTSFKGDNDQRISPKFGRPYLGEKGIGRLGVHRLGREIEIVSCIGDNIENILQINWDHIDDAIYIEDLPIIIKKQNATTFINTSGTKIIIKKLRTSWTKKLARDCARAILSLNPPFVDEGSFKADIEILNSQWLVGLTKFEDIEKYKLFYFNVLMNANQITEFEYKFIPWDTMPKLSLRIVTIEDIKNLTRMVYKDKEEKKDKDIDLSKFEIGVIRFEGIIFDRDSNTLNLGIDLDKKTIKEYLDAYGGIRVFRDKMRIMDYGEPGNDWLDLDGRRVNIPTKSISNNIILGAIYLERESSGDLIEKANREGFVENKAYWEMWKAIRFSLDRIESLRKTDKDLLRKYYGPQLASEPVITSLQEVKSVVDKHVKDESVKKDINRYLDRISKDYEEITNNLIKSAGAGLNLIIVIHQMEKIIKNINAALVKKADVDSIKDQVKTLSSLVEGYSILVKKSDIKKRNLKGIIENSIFNIEFRLEAHGIKLDAVFRDKTSALDAICSESHVVNALMNLFDNSIWWLGYSKIKNPTIFLDLSTDFPGYLSIVIADNGPGFSLPTDEIIKPFVSDKPGGMGIGLHLTQQIMESLKGKLLFPESEYFTIPKKYKKGAKIALAFKRREN